MKTDKLINKSNDVNVLQRDAAFSPPIQAKLDQLIDSTNYSQTELTYWINHLSNSLSTCDAKQCEMALLCLIHLIEKYTLDPLLGDLQLWQEQDVIHIGISMSGLMRLLHRQPQFIGINFTESPQTSEDTPNWIECAISRRDDFQVIIAREYLAEVKQEGKLWQEMPRRMLKHRAAQQAARYAFGIEFHQSFKASNLKANSQNGDPSHASIPSGPNGKTRALKAALNQTDLSEHSNSISSNLYLQTAIPLR